jgi:hypothetical protein
MNNFKEFLKRIDIFGARVELFVKNESSFKTAFSGMLTLILFSLFLSLTMSRFWVLISRSEIIAIEKIRNSPSEGEMFLGNPFGKSSFMIALGLSVPELNEYINISLLARSNVRNSTSGEFIKYRTLIPLEKCTIERFEGLENDFRTLNLSSYLCPSLDNKSPLKISGTYTDSEFNFLQIKISDCRSTKKCNSEEAQQAFFKNYSQIDFNIFTTTDEIDSSDNYRPLKKRITSEIHFLLDNKPSWRLLKTSDIFLRSLQVNFDKEVFLPMKNLETFDGIIFNGEVKDQVTTNNDNGELGNFYFRKSPYIVGGLCLGHKFYF